MTKEELASLLDGREYGQEITAAEAAQAKEAGLVVVYGASDDLMEFRGAIDDEVGCWEGGFALLDQANAGIFSNPDDCDPARCPYLKAAMEKCKIIHAVWNDDGGPCWAYETGIPHVEFTITEDGEPYCRGIVFSLKELEEPA